MGGVISPAVPADPDSASRSAQAVSRAREPSGRDPVVTRTYDGVNDDSAATSALNRLDDRLPALRAMTPVVGTYVAAIGEPDDA
jgi:hypothetical protein